MKLAVILAAIILATSDVCGGMLSDSRPVQDGLIQAHWTVQSADLVVMATPGPSTAARQLEQEATLVSTACLPGETLSSFWLPDLDQDDQEVPPPIQGAVAPQPSNPPMVEAEPVED